MIFRISTLALIAMLTALPSAHPARGNDATCLARAIWHEARGESREGQRAVAHVVLNRVEAPGFPGSVCGVVRQPRQFSPRVGRNGQGESWQQAMRVARRALAGESADPTNGATYFYAPSGASPRWAHHMQVSTRIGGHLFLKPRI